MSIYSSGRFERLKATLMTLLPFLLILAVMYLGYRFLLTDRGGAIHVDSSLPGAEILINSSPANLKTPATLRKLPPDLYDVSVRLVGYLPSPSSQVVQIRKRQTVKIFFGMMPDTTSKRTPAPEKIVSDSIPTPRPVVSWVPSLDSLKKIQESQRKESELKGYTNTPFRRGKNESDQSIFTAVTVSSTPDSALVLVDNISTDFLTPTNLILNKGTHIIKVQKDGFRSEPSRAEIVVQRAGGREQVHFQLTEEGASQDSMALIIRTVPVEGRIFIDDKFYAVGEYRVRSLNIGEYQVSFGSVEGYTTPKPQKAIISVKHSQSVIEGIYRPIVYVMATLDEKGQLIMKGVNKVINGVYFEGKGFSEDAVRGPVVKYVEGNKFYAWEMGYADAELNPPGMDGIKFVFNLPQGYDQEKKIHLRIYGYASNHNYPFTFLNKTEIAIYVNDNGLQSHFPPTYSIDAQHALGYDEFDVTGLLVEGENSILIRTADESRCFYYLNKIVLL